MKKRIMTVLAASLAALLFLYANAYADIPGFEKEIAASEGLAYLIMNGGSGRLTADIAVADGDELYLTTANTVNLNLNGHTLDLNGQFIGIDHSGAVFNLYDIHDGSTEGKITGGIGDNAGGAFNVNAGEFNMYGGVIEDCAAKTEDGETSGYGGAVYVRRGAAFTMYGGTIRNCGAGYGGAVSGGFVMMDGTIEGCTAAQDGGAVYGESFHMYGGSITGNKAFGSGGGVNSMNFHMHGGMISGNESGFGGGVFSAGDCSFDGRCVVKDNYSHDGEESWTDTGKIRDNVFLNLKLTIGQPNGAKDIAEGSEIWVNNDEWFKVFTEGAKRDDARYFFSDRDSFMAAYDDAEEELCFVSRISQDPDPEINNNTVLVDMTGLTYSAPGYQWVEIVETVELKETMELEETLELKDTHIFSGAIHGIISEGTNTVTATVRENQDGSYYCIAFFIPYGTQFVTFTCGAELSGDWDYLSFSEGKYTYLIDEISFDYFHVYGEKPFSIENVTFSGASLKRRFGDTDGTLTNGVPGREYYCYVLYQDGSYDYTYPTTVLEGTSLCREQYPQRPRAVPQWPEE